jgi:hypothetical protein
MSCRCGCGRETPIAGHTRTKLGHVKGEPTPYVAGHSSRTQAGHYPGGDERWRGYDEAQVLYPLDGVLCEICGEKPAVERHHDDGDPLNNGRSNVQLVCRRCHMVIDGRLEACRTRLRARGAS